MKYTPATLDVHEPYQLDKSAKSALKSSAVKTVKAAVAGSKAAKAKYTAKYKKIFTAKNCGKKIAVK